MGDILPHKYGCCLVFWRRGTTSETSTPIAKINDNNFVKEPNPKNMKRYGGGSKDASSVPTTTSKAQDYSSRSNSSKPHQYKPTLAVTENKVRGTSRVSPAEGYVTQGKRVPQEAVGISGELERMIMDHHKSNGSSTLVRASSSNVMLAGDLGNLRQQSTNSSNSAVGKHIRQENPDPVAYNGRNTNPTEQNVARIEKKDSASFCRALSIRMDPEQLKIMGNEDYKNGRFEEALALYDAAIALDPNKASYRSNRSAALTARGRLLEAVFECREAIQIEPHYHRAHHRLGNLYTRLGETDKALYHYKHAGPEVNPEEIARAKNLQLQLNKCTEARRLGDWNNLIKETNNAISCGADSAPQIFALQAEAFLKLRRHQDADEAMSKGPKFKVEDCTKFFGAISNANLLVTRAQVDLVAGRFEAALEAVQEAGRLDSNNREVSKVMRKAKGMAAARSNGNNLFKESKFSEACAAYEEGLAHDPYNSVLLCNRAACRANLAQYDKAVEDCTAALSLRPSYTKARLRRANCNAKLKKWEAAIQDYEILVKETPEDEEVSRALLEAKEQLSKK
ncbi:hypothetical protein HN51_037088 [Arachis hypogaea]|uniref:Uncharacterized protein n=1 Tax=Arachis hypogaea TaxID=3818 RepID=A0A444ZX49_ARAHY|nr:inactive TPR repeat-containing thioredoxin TTL3-like [Arachis hypogaea]QHO02588.1 Inactive TPR repeat-containing thioredoxin [Arachis hypogaea]RYR18793.1 hypothetical protein Ahy_B03g063410 [Arachis hypogaea]